MFSLQKYKFIYIKCSLLITFGMYKNREPCRIPHVVRFISLLVYMLRSLEVYRVNLLSC